MYEFIRLQFIMGQIDSDRVLSFVPRWITAEQADKIIKGE